MDYFDRFCFITILVADVIIVLGCVGNFLSFIVFSRRAFRKSSINIYCRALAIFDCFTVVYVVFNTGSDTDQLDFLISLKNNPGCKAFFFLIVSLSPVSGWILVVFSIDQIVSISGSRRLLRFIKNKRFQVSVIAALAISHLLLYLIVLFRLEVVDSPIAPGLNITTPLCSVNNQPLTRIMESVYLLEANVLPFLIMMLTTGYILRVLHVSTSRLSSFAANQSTVTSLAINSRYKQRKFALNSVALNVLFIVLTCPLVIGYLVISGNVLYDILVQRTLALFFFLNYSIHFATHFVVNSVFRRQFFKMVNLNWSVYSISLKKKNFT